MKSPREKGRAREIESERGDERRWQRPVGDEVHLVVLVCDLEEEEAALLLCACKFIIIISTAQLSSDRARSTVLYFTAASKGGAEKEGQDAKVEPAGVGRSVSSNMGCRELCSCSGGLLFDISLNRLFLPHCPRYVVVVPTIAAAEGMRCVEIKGAIWRPSLFGFQQSSLEYRHEKVSAPLRVCRPSYRVCVLFCGAAAPQLRIELNWIDSRNIFR